MAKKLNLSLLNAPLGPLRDKYVVDISADDYVDEDGFMCQAVGAGSLTYLTLSGDDEQTENGLQAGDIIQACGIPVLMRRVRASAGVRSIVVGKV